MELRTMRQISAIAEHKHMTRAAQELGVSQPALSAALRKLEEEVGTELFHRTGHGVELTEAGRVFIEHAQITLRAAAQTREAVRSLVGLETGSIRVGAGATATGYLLPSAIHSVRDEYPGLRFSIREAGSSAVADGVISGELDLGIVTLPVIHPRSDELMILREITDELRLIVPKGHRLDGKRSFQWSDLEGEAVVAFEAGSAVREMIDTAAIKHGVNLEVVMELRSIESIVQMVNAQIGVGFVSKYGLPDKAGLRARGDELKRGLGIIRRRDRFLSHAAGAFERALLD
ncbi:MAG: LysR family transcriptional regulator [Phycisphaerales bacterium]|nr:LysR family transcriptional regulator [Phycisphaerales bacterium]